MRLSISAKTLKYLQQQIKSGRFDSLEEAVNQLLESQVSRERLTDSDLQLLKKEIDIGLKDFERGDFAAWDPEAILADVEKIHRARQKRAG